MEKQFLDGMQRALLNAIDAGINRPEQCVISSHMAIEYAAKVLYIRHLGKSPMYRGLKEVLDELVALKKLSHTLRPDLDSLRRLRNRVYHEAYLPTEEEARQSLRLAKDITALVLA